MIIELERADRCVECALPLGGLTGIRIAVSEKDFVSATCRTCVNERRAADKAHEAHTAQLRGLYG